MASEIPILPLFSCFLLPRLFRTRGRSSTVGQSTGLTFPRSVGRVFKPNSLILLAALKSRSWSVPHSTNTQQNALSAFTRFEGKEVDAWRKGTARAFIESRMKRDHGLNLSDRVWNYTQQTKSEFEVAVSQVLANGIGKGISAESLGRQVRQYLNNPDMMYRRYHRKQLMSDGTKKDIVEWRRRIIDKEGKVRSIKEDLAKVDTGVYRSARQNTLRLTITETNMAYNYSNCKRWESEPFVLGIRICLSANHSEEDICDELAGDYPKTFMWRGWHPRCICSVSPILMDRKSDEWKKLRKMPKEENEAYQSPTLYKTCQISSLNGASAMLRNWTWRARAESCLTS